MAKSLPGRSNVRAVAIKPRGGHLAKPVNRPVSDANYLSKKLKKPFRRRPREGPEA